MSLQRQMICSIKIAKMSCGDSVVPTVKPVFQATYPTDMKLSQTQGFIESFEISGIWLNILLRLLLMSGATSALLNCKTPPD